MEDEISGPGPLLPPLKTRPGTKSQLATLSSFSDRPKIFLARCTLPMRLRSHAPLAREILLELLWRWPETKKRPFVAWKKLIDENGERDASLGRTDESNNYGDEEHLHKCLSERERERNRKYLEKVGPENEETSSSCNELEIFRFSSTWRSSLRDSYRADLL